MPLFAFRGAKIHEWTFCDPIKLILSSPIASFKCNNAVGRRNAVSQELSQMAAV